MNFTRRHLHASVSAAAILGIALGFWLGKRLEVAGTLEAIAVVAVYSIACLVVMSKIDRQFLKSD